MFIHPKYIIILLNLIIIFLPDKLIADQWNFKAYLDGKEIGQHEFRLEQTAEGKKLFSNAEFKVKFLFITAYRYKHSASEIWKSNCLQKIQSDTEDKGKNISINGYQQGNLFILESSVDTEKNEKANLPACVMTFAYWNPEMLLQKKLLNPQTGDWLDVAINSMGKENIKVRGEVVESEKFKLTAKNMQIELWYSINEKSELRQWLALRSTTPEGYVVEYSLI